MKTVLKRLSSGNKPIILRKLFFSLLFVIFYVLMLYVLINSPA